MTVGRAQPEVSIAVAVPYTEEGAQATIGLVGLETTDVQQIQESRRSKPRFSQWGWGLLVGRPSPNPIRHLTFEFPAELTEQKEWKRGADSVFADALTTMWNWSPGQPKPPLCWGAETDQEVAEAVERWCTVIMPNAAYIIHGCYLTAHGTDQVEHLWVGAAGKLARSWLAFYARPNAPNDRRHLANALMLRRVYATALIHLSVSGDLWSDDQNEELERAVAEWLAICTNDRYAWLFRRRDAGWWDHEDRRSTTLPPLEYQEYRRECEVDRMVDELQALLKSRQHQPGAAELTYFVRGQLEGVGLNWYLPRYNLISGRQVVAEGRQHRIAADVTLGFTRLWASTIVGFSVFVLQGDTWRVLNVLAADPMRFGFSFIALLAITFTYLIAGIRRKIRLDRISLQRAFVLWTIGQVLAITGAYVVTYLLRPAILVMITVKELPLCTPLLLAQLALFIGIFTQLLFDEKSATAPLDGP